MSWEAGYLGDESATANLQNDLVVGKSDTRMLRKACYA